MSHTQKQKNKAKKDDDNLDMLPPDFEPSEWDVICQRGKECFEHVGNRRFRAAIDRNLDRYLQVRSRHEKSIIVSEIVGTIRAVSNASMSLSGGGFVRKDLLTRQWYRVGDKVAREKAGQALRDAIKTRRATERKIVKVEHPDESCFYGNHPSSMSEHEAQHTFQSPINIKNARFSACDDDGSSSRACGVKSHEAFEINELSQDTTIRPPSCVHSNDVVVSCHHSKNDDGNILGSSAGHGLSQLYNASSDFETDSLCLNNARNQHQGDSQLSFLPPLAPASMQHFDSESELLSALEPRPISSVARPSSCNDDKKILPIGGVRRTNSLEQPVSDRFGSMGYMPGESVTWMDEQKPRLFVHSQQPQNRREDSSSAALQFLTHLLQPETGNDISRYYKDFFVSSTTNWHSSHSDEFGFCCDIVWSDRPTMQQLSDLADLGDSCSCVESILDEPSSTFDMMDHRSTGPTTSTRSVGISDKTMHNQDYSSVKTNSQTPYPALLQQGSPQEHHFLPSKFGSDQFLSMGRGGGLIASGPDDSRICFPDITKSNPLTLLAATRHGDTMDWKNDV